jgi:putative ATP-binding cassette transporter
MVVPAKPYIPISTLRAAVTYPAVPGTYSDDDIRGALADVHLGDPVNELNREEVWSQRLSSGEQQRVALARALLMRPDWLFLDEIDICRRRKARGRALRHIGAAAT